MLRSHTKTIFILLTEAEEHSKAHEKRSEYVRCWDRGATTPWWPDFIGRMDAFKEAAFCRRLTTFHETFAPAGHSSASKPVISAIWHEAVANRKATEVCGAIMKLLTSFYLDPDREHNHLIIWTDNCGGQNKNYTWVLFQTLYTAVHSQFVWFDKVTIKYFIAGHSFIAAELHGSWCISWYCWALYQTEPVLLNIREFEVCL